MKKVLAILLAVVMMAAFVPAFAINAAPAEEAVPTVEEAIAGKQKLVPFKSNSNTAADYLDFEIGAQGGLGCGFFDGNVYFDKANAKTLISSINEDDVLTYVDGTLVTQAQQHSGPLSYGIGGGYQLGIVGAAFTKDVASTVTIVFGNTGYYTEFTVTPDANTLGYESAEVVIRGVKSTVTVKSASIAAAYTVGQTVSVELHDAHVDHGRPASIFTVKSITDDTVVFTCDDFAATDKTILEVGKGTDAAFTAMVTENRPGGVIASPDENETFKAAFQERAVGDDIYDYRFLFSAKLATLVEGYADGTSIAQTAKLNIVYNTGVDATKSVVYDFSNLAYYKEVVSNGAYYVPESDEDVLLGVVVTDVPLIAWSSFTVTITKGDEVLFTSNLTPNYESQNRVTTPGYVWIYGEQNINASTGKNSGGESSGYFFDKTGAKYGYASGGADQTITWNYSAAKTVAMYAIYTGNDSYANSTRNPTKWTLYGSTDGVDYTVIDYIENPQMKDQGQGVFFEIANPVPYQYYKITFGTQNDYFQIGEIKLFEKATTPAYDMSTVEKFPAVSNKGCSPEVNSDSEGLNQLFDDNNGTKLGYYANTNGMTVTWSYDQAYTAKLYEIVTGGDSLNWNRNPSSWTLYGSTDGTNWVSIDTAVYTANLSSDALVYVIDNPGAYQHYKIEFVVTNHAFQLSEIRLYK